MYSLSLSLLLESFPFQIKFVFGWSNWYLQTKFQLKSKQMLIYFLNIMSTDQEIQFIKTHKNIH